MGAKLEKRVAYNYNIQSAYIMSAKGEIYDLVELLGNVNVIVTTSGLINIARCGISSVDARIENLINIARCGISNIGMRVGNLIDTARCDFSRIGMRVGKSRNFEGNDVVEVAEAREFLGEDYENLKEGLDVLYEELYVKVEGVNQLRNPAIADIINGQDEVRRLQDLNKAYMSDLRGDMQNTNHEAEAINLDLDMRLLMLEGDEE